MRRGSGKSLADHNRHAKESIELGAERSRDHLAFGIGCPRCGHEVKDWPGPIRLPITPPEVLVACGACAWLGWRVI
jgi:hypothetical protein